MASVRSLCVVDDAADYRFLLQQLYKKYFPAYQIQLFSSGTDFLNELDQLSSPPGLILLDRHMPGLDGHQTLLRLKQHPEYRTIPVVMMSSAASAVEIYNCYEAGANSFLRKPIDFMSLKETMSVLCEYWLELNLEPSPGIKSLAQPVGSVAS